MGYGILMDARPRKTDHRTQSQRTTVQPEILSCGLHVTPETGAAHVGFRAI